MATALISADSHVNPPPTFWQEYLPAQFRDRAPRVESTPEGDVLVFEGKRSLMEGLGSNAGRRPEQYTQTIRRLDEVRPGGWDPRARLEDQALDGVDAEVLYGGGPLRSTDPALRLASHAAYNDWLADFCAVAPDRLIGMAYLPCETVEGAVAEARRAAAKGLRGAVIPAFAPLSEWADPLWDPLWRTLVDLGLPAHIHVGVRNPRRDSGTHFMTDMVMSKVGMAEPLANLIYGGVLERFPDLRVVAVEGQIGWIPFVRLYMDHIYHKHRFWTKSDLPQLPSFYLDRQVSATFMEDEVGIRERHAIGVGNIMWSSDYPHSETTWPDSQKLITEWFKEVPEEEKTRIVRENARRLYRL